MAALQKYPWQRQRPTRPSVGSSSLGSRRIGKALTHTPRWARPRWNLHNNWWRGRAQRGISANGCWSLLVINTIMERSGTNAISNPLKPGYNREQKIIHRFYFFWHPIGGITSKLVSSILGDWFFKADLTPGSASRPQIVHLTSPITIGWFGVTYPSSKSTRLSLFTK